MTTVNYSHGNFQRFCFSQNFHFLVKISHVCTSFFSSVGVGMDRYCLLVKISVDIRVLVTGIANLSDVAWWWCKDQNNIFDTSFWKKKNMKTSNFKTFCYVLNVLFIRFLFHVFGHFWRQQNYENRKILHNLSLHFAR